MRHRLPVISIFDIPIVCATENEALTEIEYLADQDKPALIAYVNAHTLELCSKNVRLRQILKNGAVVLNDGIGVAIAGVIMRRTRFPANLNGTDLTPRILDLASKRGWRVFVLGAASGVAEIAAKKMVESNPKLVICGTQSGFFQIGQESAIIQKIREAKTDVLVVGMGNPRQEIWLDRRLEETGARLGIGVGAFIDFTAGIFPRAPHWMQNFKVEWLYRMYREPNRLCKRYLIGGPVFLTRVIFHSLKDQVLG